MPYYLADDDVETPEYSDTEKEFYNMLIEQMQSSINQRNQSYAEFDDMTYKEYYESNIKAANSYIPPKVNNNDIRTTSGTTKEKTNTILTSLLNYNLEPSIEAYDDEDYMVVDLGNAMEDLVKKSRKIEIPDYDVKRILEFKELLDQGTVFVEDQHIEFSIPNKEASNFNVENLNEMQWKDRIDKIYRTCNTNVLCGLNVYLGNIREFYMQLQPYVFIRRLLNRYEAESIYSDWQRWENVPKIMNKITQGDSDNVPFNTYTMEEVENQMIEEVKYYNPWTNNYMILLNGVMMFPVKKDKKGRLQTFPLNYLTGESKIPVAKGDIEPISRYFAYSKSVPAKTKVDQAVFDEMLKSIIIKTRKSYQPPLANNTGKNLSKAIFYPGTIHSDINPEKLQEIGTNTGVTAPEFNAVQFIKQIIDEKSVSPIFEGQNQRGNQTKFEIQLQQQQGMKKLGLAILGAINLEKELVYLRVLNILKNWTKPIDNNLDKVKKGLKYMNVSLEADFEDGNRGQKVIEFTDNPPTTEQVMAEEELLSEVNNKQYRKIYLNAKELSTFKYNWYIEIVPTEKNTSELKVAMFEEMIQKMLAIFAPLGKQPNLDFIATRWATLSGEDPNKLFPPSQEQQMMPQMQSMPQMQQQGGNMIASQLTPNREQRPSVNALMQ